MNEKKAYILALDLWIWHYENPLTNHEDYPLFKELKFSRMQGQCSIWNHFDNCESCPMNIDPDYGGGCLDMIRLKAIAIRHHNTTRYKRICSIYINAFNKKLESFS